MYIVKDVLLRAIDEVDRVESEVPELKNLYSFNGWVREFRTIKFCGPRRIGHTTGLIQAINERFGLHNAILVFPYNNQVENAKKITYGLGVDWNKFKFCTQSSFPEALVGRDFNVIGIDCSWYYGTSFLTETVIEAMHVSYISNKKPPYLILVG